MSKQGLVTEEEQQIFAGSMLSPAGGGGGGGDGGGGIAAPMKVASTEAVSINNKKKRDLALSDVTPSSSSSSSPPYTRELEGVFQKIKKDIYSLSIDELEDIDDLVRSFNAFLSNKKAEKQKQLSIKRQKVVSSSQAALTTTTTTITSITTLTKSSSRAITIAPSPPPGSRRATGTPKLDQVLQLVIHSGFLKSPDLGRTLLLTHPSITPALTPEFVFTSLYNARRLDRWASPSSSSSSSNRRRPNNGTNDWIPDATIKARGHRNILNAIESAPVTKTNIVALPHVSPLPVLSSSNTIFIVSLWVLSQKIYSHQLTMNELERLTRTGHCYVPVQKSVVDIAKMSFQKDSAFVRELRRIRQQQQHQHQQDGTMKNSANKNKKGGRRSNSLTTEGEEPFITARIHAIRLDTHQLCTLYDSNLPRYEMRRSHATNDGVDFPLQRALKMRNSANGSSDASTTTISSTNSSSESTSTDSSSSSTTSSSTKSNASDEDDGDDILARWYKGYPDGIRNVGGLTFQVTLTDRRLSTNPSTSASTPPSSTTMHIQAKVLGATANQCESLRPRNGVNPFHILQGLAGWK